jgi:hypothetical protein
MAVAREARRDIAAGLAARTEDRDDHRGEAARPSTSSWRAMIFASSADIGFTRRTRAA